MNNIIGLLPAAGTAERLRPFRYPKELLPVGYVEEADGSMRPILAAEYSLLAMKEAGIEKCVIVVNDTKTEILKYFGDGSELGMALTYVVQRNKFGLPGAIATAAPWFRSYEAVCMTLPDTLFTPRTAVQKLCIRFLAGCANLSLAVFPTDNPQDLGPVEFGKEGIIGRVYDKPRSPCPQNTWGITVWQELMTPVFGACDEVRSLGELFQSRIARHYCSAEALYFEDGSFIDIGKASNLRQLIPGKL